MMSCQSNDSNSEIIEVEDIDDINVAGYIDIHLIDDDNDGLPNYWEESIWTKYGSDYAIPQIEASTWLNAADDIDDDLGSMEDENQVNISELMERNTILGPSTWSAIREGVQSCIRKGKNWGRAFRVSGDSLIETTPEVKNDYPVVYMSAGLKK